jgi:hypothetical protein
MKEKLPINILFRPTKTTKTKPSFLRYILNKMRELNLSISPIGLNQKQSFYQALTDEEYQSEARTINKFNLHQSETLTMASNPTKLISFEQWADQWPTFRKDQDMVPNFFQLALRYHSSEAELLDLDFSFNDNFTKKLQEQDVQMDSHVTSMTGPQFKIYTDGSLSGESMGSAAVIYNEDQTEYQTIIGRPPEGNPSSTKAELWAIYLALTSIPKEH